MLDAGKTAFRQDHAQGKDTAKGRGTARFVFAVEEACLRPGCLGLKRGFLAVPAVSFGVGVALLAAGGGAGARVADGKRFLAGVGKGKQV